MFTVIAARALSTGARTWTLEEERARTNGVTRAVRARPYVVALCLAALLSVGTRAIWENLAFVVAVGIMQLLPAGARATPGGRF